MSTIPLGDSPEAIYLSPDGKWLSAAIEENDLVLLIDTATLKIAKRLKMKGKNPEHAVFSPDGKWLYASAEEADSVDIFDVARGELVKSVTVGERPRGIGFLPDGSRAYVAAENADTDQRVRHQDARRDRAHQGGQAQQRHHRASRRQARVRLVRRRRHRAGDRHCNEHDHRDDPRRTPPVEHGAHAGRRRSSTSPVADPTRSR